MKICHKNSGYSWNAGGWFGSILGCSAWMGVCAARLLCSNQYKAALAAGLCFIFTCTTGIILWHRRDKINIFHALQFFLAVYMLYSAMAIAGIYFTETSDHVREIWKQLPWIFIIIPTIMIILYIINVTFKGKLRKDLPG